MPDPGITSKLGSVASMLAGSLAMSEGNRMEIAGLQTSGCETIGPTRQIREAVVSS